MKNYQSVKPVVIFCFALLCFSLRIMGQSETEPNNTYGTANVLAVNSGMTGSVGETDNFDWYVVNLPSDGKIEVIETMSSQLRSGINLFDSNGANVFSGKWGVQGGTDALVYDTRAAGVFYVRINNDNYSSGTYTLQLNFYPADLDNDTEPNNLFSESFDLAVNIPTTGHIGYYANFITDTDDWYKVTLPSDGKLEVIETMSSQLKSGINLFDSNGANVFIGRWGRLGGSDTLVYNNRAAGVFYVRINNDNYSYGSYVLNVNFYPADFRGDTEPNNVISEAIDLEVNTLTTGHIGYYANFKTDTEDWYQVTLPSDSKLEVIETMSSQLKSGINLFDNNGTNAFSGRWGRLGGSDTLVVDKRTAGVFYVRINNDNYSYGSYNLRVNFYPSTFVDDLNNPDSPLSIFPNPSNGKFTIKGDDINSIDVYNILGEKVYSTTVITIRGNCEIDLSSLQKQIYLVKINDGRKVYTRKVMIQQ